MKQLELTSDEKLALVSVWDNLHECWKLWSGEDSWEGKELRFGQFMLNFYLPDFCSPWSELYYEERASVAYAMIHDFLCDHDIHVLSNIRTTTATRLRVSNA